MRKSAAMNIYTCKICDEVFFLKSALKKHDDEEHDVVITRLTCSECGQKYFWRKYYEEHLKTHEQEKTQSKTRLVGKKSKVGSIDSIVNESTEMSKPPAKRPRLLPKAKVVLGQKVDLDSCLLSVQKHGESG